MCTVDGEPNRLIVLDQSELVAFGCSRCQHCRRCESSGGGTVERPTGAALAQVLAPVARIRQAGRGAPVGARKETYEHSNRKGDSHDEPKVEDLVQGALLVRQA